MSTIKVKNIGEIEVDFKTAKMIAEMKEKGTTAASTWIKAGKWAGIFSDITAVITSDNSNITEAKKDFANQIRSERAEIFAESPEVRCERLGMFKLYHKAVTGELATDIVLDKAKELQKAYFTKYPNKCFCNYLIFNKAIYTDNNIPKNKKMDKISLSVLNLIGQIERNDRISATVYNN